MSGPTTWNRKGMFENAVLRNMIVKPMLKEWKVDPLGQEPLPDIEMMRNVAKDSLVVGRLRNSVLEVMEFQGYEEGSWFYKGAKMCLMWPLWHAAFPRAKWIIVRRDLPGIVNSCMKTSFMRKRNSVESWTEWVRIHEQRFVEMREAGLDIYEVSSNKLLNGEMEEFMGAIKTYLRLCWNEERVNEFIEPALFHK